MQLRSRSLNPIAFRSVPSLSARGGVQSVVPHVGVDCRASDCHFLGAWPPSSRRVGLCRWPVALKAPPSSDCLHGNSTRHFAQRSRTQNQTVTTVEEVGQSEEDGIRSSRADGGRIRTRVAWQGFHHSGGDGGHLVACALICRLINHMVPTMIPFRVRTTWSRTGVTGARPPASHPAAALIGRGHRLRHPLRTPPARGCFRSPQ